MGKLSIKLTHGLKAQITSQFGEFGKFEWFMKIKLLVLVMTKGLWIHLAIKILTDNLVSNFWMIYTIILNFDYILHTVVSKLISILVKMCAVSVSWFIPNLSLASKKQIRFLQPAGSENRWNKIWRNPRPWHLS
jgi:hypothetical protein